MLPIDKTTSSTDLRKLKPGQLFVYKTYDSYAMAAAMTQEGKFAPWLTLTGPNAFQLGTLENASQQLSVLTLGIDANALHLRIDHSTVTESQSGYQTGQLIFPSDGGACIAAVWPDLKDKNYHNVVKLTDWSQSQDDFSGFRVARWSLSYVDKAGHWTDLVTRDPSPAPMT